MSKNRKAARTVATPKTKTPTIPEHSEESRAARAGGNAVSADITAALVVAEFSRHICKDPLDVLVGVMGMGLLADKVEAVHRGNLRDAEALLMAQAVGLNSVYTELVLFAKKNLGDHFDAAERLLRLGLKAQGQCRATLEKLATIKNPPTVFARQANIAQGPQQVNNTVSLASGDAQPLARAGNQESEPNKLL